MFRSPAPAPAPASATSTPFSPSTPVSGTYSFSNPTTSNSTTATASNPFSPGMSQATRSAVREINRSLNDEVDIIESNDYETPKTLTEAKAIIEKMEQRIHFMKLNISNLEVDVADKTEEMEGKQKEMQDMAGKLKAWHDRAEKLKSRGMQLKIEARLSEFGLMMCLFYIMFPAPAAYIGKFIPIILYHLVAGNHHVFIALRSSFVLFTLGKERNWFKTKLVNIMNCIVKY